MFDFYKEVIINSQYLPVEEGVDHEGNPFKRFSALTSSSTMTGNTLAPKDPIFRVLRCADYSSKGVAEGIVYKTEGRVGTPASVEFDLNGLEDGVYRILMDVSLIGRYYSEYQHPWSEFHKPVMVEFEVKGGVDAEAVAALLKKYVPADYKYVTSASDGDKVTVKCTDPYQVIKLAKIQKLVEDGCIEGCSGVNYEDVLEGTITANVTPFATGEWLTENLRFPTYPNLRYASANIDERPIPGALYTQYSFGYCSPRRGLTGQGTVGQMLASVTHHVFYVLNDLVDDFEAAIKEGLDITDFEVITPGQADTPQLIMLNGVDPIDNEVTFKVADLKAGVALRVNLVGETSKSDVTNSTTFAVKQETGHTYKVNGNKLTSANAADGDTGTITAKYESAAVTVTYKVVEG